LESEEDVLMASHSTSISELNVNINRNVVRQERATESCTPLTLKQRLEKLLCEIFEGYEEYLGVTPD
jgi:hypothetical protein